MSFSNSETFLNKLFSAAVIGLLAWNLHTTQALTVQVGKLEERMDVIRILEARDIN